MIALALAERAQLAAVYFRLRAEKPLVPAAISLNYARDPGGVRNFDEFICEQTTGHSWSYSGSAYGGDDESYHGEGRCYCAHCGADGDA